MNKAEAIETLCRVEDELQDTGGNGMCVDGCAEVIVWLREELLEHCDDPTGESVEGALLETSHLIPEIDGDVIDEQSIVHGWWPMFDKVLFDWEKAICLRDHWAGEGFDVKVESVFSEAIMGSDARFFRLWFRRKKAE